MIYDKEYYTSLNYTDYLSREGKYKQTAQEISHLLSRFNLLSAKSKILDFGCATGFLTKALMNLGCDNISGFDISEWAIGEAKKNNVPITYTYKGDYDLVFCLDVLEHMTDEDIKDFFLNCKATAYMIRIPCSVDEGKTYALDVSNQDETHINCKTKKQWHALFNSIINYVDLPVNTYTIYDTEGVMCSLILRK
tara:strand:+ start:271 stop:852 length:582 start_codon:yes stop_codon:yes gene_type:complete